MKSILNKIKPSKKEQKQYLAVADSFIKKLKIDAKIILGGSAKKGTIISGNHDIDIFVAFERGTKDISKILGKALKKSFPKITKLHGSRDYYQTTYQNYTIEILPIIAIKQAEDAQNITDISPLHATWVNKQASSKIKDDIRLLKQFCKANSLYGAESFISGFSGYVIEILTINYGSFQKVLQAATKWKNKVIIDPSKFYPAKMALFHINNSKLNSPIVVVDPVDKSRNAAAALSKEKLSIFVSLSKQYLKKPEEKYFVKKEISIAKLKKKGAIILKVTPVTGKHDVVGMKLLKVFELIKKELKLFKLKQAGWVWGEKTALFYYITKDKTLPKETIRPGPPLNLKDFVKDFKKKNKKTFVENGRILAKIKTEFPKLEDFLANLLKSKYVRERVKRINELN